MNDADKIAYLLQSAKTAAEAMTALLKDQRNEYLTETMNVLALARDGLVKAIVECRSKP